MIVRILGQGQFEVADAESERLNKLDSELMAAVESGASDRFKKALCALIDRVREVGSPLAEDDLRPSDVVLPDEEASIDEVRELLGDEGLIPG